MIEPFDPHRISAAQKAHTLALLESQLRELTERVRTQDELLAATADALATIFEQLSGEAQEVAARLRDLMFDRKNLSDRASPL